MSGQLLIFAGSFAAIAVLVLVSMLLGLGRDSAILDEAAAAALADDAYCGFGASEVAIDQAGRTALVANKAGQIVLIVPHGAHFTARLLGKGTTAALSGTILTIRIEEAAFPAVRIELGEATKAWAGRLDGLNS